MGKLVIPDVPDETIRALEHQAEISGRSLAEEVRRILEAFRSPGAHKHQVYTVEQRAALTKRFHSETPAVQRSLTAEERREGLL